MSAEDMLKSAVIEEKKFKHSLWARADNPLVPKFWCQPVGLITMVICCKFKKNLFNLWLYTHLFMILNIYNHRSGADNPRGQNFDIKRNLLSLRSFATSLKNSLRSDFIHFFMILYMYVGCSGSSWNLVIKCSNIYIILSFFEISQVDINELASRSLYFSREPKYR